MRAWRWLGAGLLVVSLAACGKQEPAKQAAAPNPEEIAKVSEELFGRWQLARDSDIYKRIDWAKVGITEKELDIRFKRDGYLMFVAPEKVWGAMCRYEVTSGDTVEITGDASKGDPPRKKVKVQVQGETLTVIDEQNKVEKYARKKAAASGVRIKGLPLYDEPCAAALKSALEKHKDVTDVKTDVKARGVTFRIKDRDDATSAYQAEKDAGMSGEVEVLSAKGGTFTMLGPVIGAATPRKEVVFERMHACCPACQKAIAGAVKNAKVTFEGEGPTRTVKFTGDSLDGIAITNALRALGFDANERGATAKDK